MLTSDGLPSALGSPCCSPGLLKLGATRASSPRRGSNVSLPARCIGKGAKVARPASSLLVLWSPEAQSLGEEAELASWGVGVGTEAVPVHPVPSCPAPLPTSREPLGATCPQTDAPGRSSRPSASIHVVPATPTCCPTGRQASAFRPLLQNTWTRPRAVLLMGPAASEGFPCLRLPFPVSCTTCTRYECTVCVITSTRGRVPLRTRKRVRTYVCTRERGHTIGVVGSSAS